MSKKFLSLEGLQKYDLLIKQELAKKAEADHNHNDMYYTESEIDAKLTEVNESISNITSGDVVVPKAEEATHAVSADSATSATSAESATKATQDASGNVIVDTYETKVDAAAKLDAAKEYADGKDTAIAEAKQAGVDAASAASVAQAAADKAQGDVDDLKTYVGTIPAGATATDIVGYVQEKTSGIASEGAMTELSNRVGVVEGKVGTIEGDYLKGSDKEELKGLITAEAETARDAEKANADAIKAISDDYLKKADKEELQGNIKAVSDKVTTLIGEDVNKSVRTIANEELAKQLIAEGAQESLDTLAEIAAWIQAHPEDASAMNKAINDLEALVGTLPEGITATTVVGYIAEVQAALSVAIEEAVATAAADAATKDAVVLAETQKAMNELAALIDEVKDVQADWKQNDESAPDYIKNRTHWVEESMAELIPDTEIPEVDGRGLLAYEAFIKLNVGETYIVTCDGTEYNCIAKDLSSFAPDLVGLGNLSGFNMPSDEPFNVLSDGKAFEILTTSPCTMSIKHSVETVHQLDEKFIPDTIARVDLVDSMIMDAQADWNQNDESAPDFIKNRTHYETVAYIEYRPEMVVVTDELVEETGAYVSNQSTDLFVGTGVYTVILDGVTYENIEFTQGHTGNRFLWEKELTFEGDTTHNPNLPFAFSYNGMGNSFFYSTTAGEHTLTVLQKNGTEVKQLDEKFIPDTIARVSAVEEVAGRMTTAEGKIADIEAMLGDGEGSVADMIADAKQEAIDAAVEAASTAADTKDEAILAAAQEGIDGVQEALDAHTGNADIHVTTDDKTKWNAALQASDITIGGANGTIAVKGADVVVKGLGSAAFVETTSFDASGAANQALVDAKAYTDAAFDQIEEVAEADINALFA